MIDPIALVAMQHLRAHPNERDGRLYHVLLRGVSRDDNVGLDDLVRRGRRDGCRFLIFVSLTQG